MKSGYLRRRIIKTIHFIWIFLPKKIKNEITLITRDFYSLIEHKKFSTGFRKYKHKRTAPTITDNPKISIIIPVFNHPRELKNCLKAIKKNTMYKNYEIILVDNNSFDKDTITIMKTPGYKYIKYSYKFNFSKMNNLASNHADGKYLLFLNVDTIPTRNWLTNMLNECQKDDVGIVGCKLLYPDKTIQHAGMELDYNLRFYHKFRHWPASSKEANILCECNAVTGACMMIRKSTFKGAGGFDEDYWIEAQDADICYKIRKSGLKVIYTPHASVFHLEHLLINKTPETVTHHDISLFRKKWLSDYLIHDKQPQNNRLNPNSVSNANSGLKILIIKLMTLGDVVMCTPVIEALKKKYPNSEITFATSKEYAQIIKKNPFVDRVLSCRKYDKKFFHNPLNYYHSITLELLRRNTWDKAYQLQILDLPYGHWGTDHHMADLYADMANARITDEKMVISVTDEARKIVQGLLNEDSGNTGNNIKRILIHTTSGWSLKDWDYKKYDTLINLLKEKYNAEIIQIGSIDEKLKNNNILHFQNKLTLIETAALMEKSDLLICPDSGPMHMAQALNLPCVALFGPTNPASTGPRGSNYVCIQSNLCCKNPCHMKKCTTGNYCMNNIETDTVLKAAEKLLNRKADINETRYCDKIYAGTARNVFQGAGSGGFRI